MRPHVRTVVTVVPKLTVENVTVQRVKERVVVKEEYSEDTKKRPIGFEKPTFAGKKGEQLYGPQWRAHIQQTLEGRYGGGQAPKAQETGNATKNSTGTA